MKIKKLGVFDSGIGGLSVLNELITLPIPNFVYFADTKNLPYGEKTPEQIKAFTLHAMDFLAQQEQVDAIVLACHTASAVALEYVQAQLPTTPIWGVVDPVVSAAAAATKNQRIGIIGTPATIMSGIHKTKILALNPSIEVFCQACPKLVPLIEEGKQKTSQLEAALWEYLAPLQHAGIDTLIIGCTHYELIKHEIRELAGSELRLISAPEQMVNLFNQHGLLTRPGHIPQINYYATSSPDRFAVNAQKIVVNLFTNQKVTLPLSRSL